jgi:hypothetical protein
MGTAGVPQTDILRPPLWALLAGTFELYGYFREVSVEKRERNDRRTYQWIKSHPDRGTSA